MKWLSAGLIFVNLSTVCGLLFGMAGNGLNQLSAILSLISGAAFALAAYLGTSGTSTGGNISNSPAGKFSSASPDKRYRYVWVGIMAVCFALFALRSFCWLLYIEGDELRIQSPNNLGDLALHITFIKNFANGVALWPDNPIYVFSKLRYPAGMDLFNGLLCLVHVDLTRGLVWTGLIASLATFYAFFRWAGTFGVAGFLFNGGIAGFEFLRTLKFVDYQGGKMIAWKSIPLTMFLTQRGLLYAIPAGLLLLWSWRERFRQTEAKDRRRAPLPFWVELSLYASMPFFHVHTFLALTIVLVSLFCLELLKQLNLMVDFVRKRGIAAMCSLVMQRTRRGAVLGDMRIGKHVALLVTGSLLPATFFVWLISDHFQAASMIEWKPCWVMHDPDFGRPTIFQFWFDNFGVFIPLAVCLFAVCVWRLWKSKIKWNEKLPEDIAFLLPAAAIFVSGLLFKFAPWEWDNLKLMMWGYFLVLPFLWTQLIARWSIPIRVGVCIALFGSGFVSLFGGLAAGRPGFGLAERAELDAVGAAVRKLPIEARFAAYPTYNHPLLLQGRKVVLGYPGHLWTQGFKNYENVEQKLRELMEGAQNWREIARALRVRYVFWGREEMHNYPASKRPWAATAPLVASGHWGAIYDLENR
jgi:hypothetical protein